MSISRSDVIGKWSIHEVTDKFKGQDDATILQTLGLIDSGSVTASAYRPSAGAPAVSVEISETGSMVMSIVRSMRPSILAEMNIEATIEWDIRDDSLVTTPRTDTLKVHVDIDEGLQLSFAALAERAKQLESIETGTLHSLKSSPVWTNRNTVRLVGAGRSFFLTRSESGILMLHIREGE